MSNLADQSDPQPMQNAAEIIERFGGIRPMSAKVNVAVTTIQGWKKRGVIPANRVNAVLAAAKEKNIKIADLLETSSQPAKPSSPLEFEDDFSVKIAEKQLPKEYPAEANIEINAIPQQPVSVPATGMAARRAPEEKPAESSKPSVSSSKSPDKNYTELVIESDSRVMKRGAYIATGLMGLIVFGAILIVWKNSDDPNKVTQIAFSKDVPEEEPGTFKGLVPDNWKEQLTELTNDANEAGKAIGQAVGEMEQDFLGEDAGTMGDRIVKLETYVSEIAGKPLFAGLSDRFETMQQSLDGQETLDQSMAALHAMIKGSDSADSTQNDEAQKIRDFNTRLEQVREENPSLRQSLGGVQPNDLQAAAMLLAMTQMRSTLNRDNVPFEDDLEILMGMVGEDNEELRTALNHLSPYAKDGVLTPSGVSNEFRSLTDDVVASSLEGEDVSLVEKARAKMNEVFQVEKGGELVTGTEIQAIVSKAQNQLEVGDIRGAIDLLMDQLDAKELEPLRPWIKKAQAALSAKDLKQAIERAININAGDFKDPSRLNKTGRN